MGKAESRMRSIAPVSIVIAIILAQTSAGCESPVSRTSHELTINGRALRYEGVAGQLIVADHDGTPRAHIFFRSYRLLSKSPRPVTFFFPGGPGSAGGTQDLDEFGPKRLVGGVAIANRYSLLPVSDLVFIDPVSTGYSRLEDPANSVDFYSTAGDLVYLARLVERWIHLFGSKEAPVFVGGASFGVPRANGVAERLVRHGVPVRGTILISGGRIAVTTTLPPALDAALRAPGQAMAAYAHAKMTGSSAEAVRRQTEEWARARYYPILKNADKLDNAARANDLREVSEHIGVSPALIDHKTLSLGPRAFNAAIDPPHQLALLDRRQIVGSPEKLGSEPPQAAADQKSYLLKELGYRTSLEYWNLGDPGQPPVNASWRFTGNAQAVAWAKAGGGPPESAPWITRTLKISPAMKVFVAVGYYDSQNSCEVNEETQRRLPYLQRRAIFTHCYIAGHSILRDEPALRDLSRDVSRFIVYAAENNTAGDRNR